VDPLSLPLRVDDRGWLVRSDRKQLLVELLRVMALTYAGTWAPDPEFGIRLQLETAKRGSLPQSAIDALNRSLERLGMSDYRVTAIERFFRSGKGESSYTATVVSTGRGPEFLELKV